MEKSKLNNLSISLFPNENDRRAFLQALRDPASGLKCAIWTLQDLPERFPPALAAPIPSRLAELPIPDWLSFAPADTDAGKHPLFAAGAFYPLDFSSVFAASPLLTLDEVSERRVLDVCAAPGGKAVFAARALSPQYILCNETVGKRLGILRQNLARCRIPRAFTQQLDVARLANAASGAFDVVVVDAPCSGQSLLAKGVRNPGCFHASTINRNLKRQRRILCAAAEIVAPGGYLLYSTCTFSPQENERVVAWLKRRRPELCPLRVPFLEPWRSELASFPCYRLYPHQGLGAGAFVCWLGRDRAGQRLQPRPGLLDFPIILT